MCQSLFLNKVAILLKRKLQHGCCEGFRNSFFYSTLPVSASGLNLSIFFKLKSEL